MFIWYIICIFIIYYIWCNSKDRCSWFRIFVCVFFFDFIKEWFKNIYINFISFFIIIIVFWEIFFDFVICNNICFIMNCFNFCIFNCRKWINYMWEICNICCKCMFYICIDKSYFCCFIIVFIMYILNKI